MIPAHAPTPWKADEPYAGFCKITDANGEVVFALSAPSPQYGDSAAAASRAEASLAHIIESVNLHAEMVEALKDVRDTVIEANDVPGWERIDAVLRKAGAK